MAPQQAAQNTLPERMFCPRRFSQNLVRSGLLVPAASRMVARRVRLHTDPQILNDDPQMRHVLGHPLLRRVHAGDPFACGRLLDEAHPVPHQAADIKFVTPLVQRRHSLPEWRETVHPIRWRQAYGGLKVDQVKRLKELEAENARLRRAVSDVTLEKLLLKESCLGNLWSAP
jgi:hypothetical protein